MHFKKLMIGSIKNWFYDTKKLIDSNIISKKDDLVSHIRALIENLLEQDVIGRILNNLYDRSYILPRQVISVGGVKMGDGIAPVIQTMTMTSLKNLDTIHNEFKDLVDAGAEIVRFAVLSKEDALMLYPFKERLKNEKNQKYNKIPLVMCGQYNVAPIIKETNILNYISKVRINPGNIERASKGDDNFAQIIKYLIEHNKGLQKDQRICVRIGVNWGSLDEKLKMLAMNINSKLTEQRDSGDVLQIALVASCVLSGLYAYMLGLEDDLIVVSCKTSDVKTTYIIYKLLAMICDYNIHLGLTEAGGGDDGIVMTSAALSPLLLQNIGNTIRVSITPKMHETRTKEVKVCKQILQAVGARDFAPRVISCPGCGRTDSAYFRELAQETDAFIKDNIEQWSHLYGSSKGLRQMKVAVMGCIVNGPGESKHANIGISLPGFGESYAVVVYLDGQKFKVLRGDNIRDEFFEIIEDYVKNNYAEKEIKGL